MKTNGRNISLTSYDDIFSTEEVRTDVQREQIQQIPLSELLPFKDHPFKVLDDDRMMETTESIKEFGVLVPAIARPLPDGGYELIAGHRRKRACELAGLESMPVIVRNMDDDAAIIVMVDSNLQRENILPSERAKAYQMKMEALKHQGERHDLTSCQVGTKLRTDEIVAESVGDSARNVQRFVRLTSLAPQLLDMVDDKQLAFNPAVELSYLKEDEQKQLASALEVTQSTPSLAQAQRIKKLSQQGGVTEQALMDIMSEEKKPMKESVTLSHDTLRKYFPKSYSTQQIEKVIFKLLDAWVKKREQQQER